MIHIKYELNDEERAILARSRVASATNRRWAIVMNALSAVLLLSGALWAFMQGERSWSTLYFASISVYFGALVVTGLVGLDGVDAAFTALRDPDAHAKILIDPMSEATSPQPM